MKDRGVLAHRPTWMLQVPRTEEARKSEPRELVPQCQCVAVNLVEGRCIELPVVEGPENPHYQLYISDDCTDINLLFLLFIFVFFRHLCLHLCLLSRLHLLLPLVRFLYWRLYHPYPFSRGVWLRCVS